MVDKYWFLGWLFVERIDVKIIMSENDPANLRLFEAFYIRKCKPTLSSREECTEFADLLF